MSGKQRILVTGATGYVGSHLIPRLLDAGYPVRAMARHESGLRHQPWRDRVEVVEADVLKPESLPPAMNGADTAFYLIHSMGSGGKFHEQDVAAARNFSRAAKEGGVRRIIYLGGLGDPESDLSPHLRSRQETGRALRDSGVPVTEFRAAVVIGSGSLSFELIRYLTERLPVMVCPRWVYTRVQPIAIDNVLDYLAAALEQPESAGRVIEIGGSDVLTYGGMMMGYAAERGLRRLLIPVPVLTPRLSSYWIHLVTPLPARIAKPLILGLRNEVVVRADDARKLFPGVRLIGYPEAVKQALQRGKKDQFEVSERRAAASHEGEKSSVRVVTDEGMIREQRRMLVRAPAEKVYAAFTSLGGARGWLYMDWAWQLRGAVDGLLGGVGMRRHKPRVLKPGEVLDFWRIDAMEKGRMLRLRAEMKVPGKAWLQFHAHPHGDGQSELTQVAFFEPKGLAGVLYWWLLYPMHSLIFSGLIRRVAQRAEKGD